MDEVEKTKEGRALTMLHSSFPAALRFLHPDVEWNPSRFNSKALDALAEKLGIARVCLDYFNLYVNAHKKSALGLVFRH